MPVIDIDALNPWDLTLKLSGRSVATILPSWGDIVAMSDIKGRLDAATGPEALLKLDSQLRGAIGKFLQEEDRPLVNGCSWAAVMGVFAALQGYFGEWQKKGVAACSAAGQAAANPTGSATSGV